MLFRTYKNTDLTVSEVGFGLWTISTGWWGNFTEGEAIALMHKAFDLGITLFGALDSGFIVEPCATMRRPLCSLEFMRAQIHRQSTLARARRRFVQNAGRRARDPRVDRG